MSKKVKLWAEINGKVIDCLSFRCSFELNAIPQAACVLGTGQKFVGGKVEPSSTPDILSVREKQQVFVKGDFESLPEIDRYFRSQRDLPPFGAATLFEGYTTGVDFSRTPYQVGTEMGIEHWLADMSFSSAVTDSSHAANPSQALANLFLTTEGNPAAALTGLSLARRVVQPAAAAGGLWSKGIKVWLQALAATNNQTDNNPDDRSTLLAQSALGQAAAASGGLRTGNPQGLAALNRILDDPDLKPTSEMSASFVLGKLIDFMASSSLEASLSITLWDNLISWVASQLMFAVVPRVSDALVVPHLPTLRTHFETIRASEIDPIQTTKLTPRQLRGVVMSVPMSGSPDQASINPCGIYSYINPAAQGRGLLAYTHAPSWLRDHRTSDMIDVSNLVRPQGKPGDGPPPTEAANQYADNVRAIVPLFLRSLYHQEVLKHRFITVAGPLRYDIAPGSIVRIECPPEKFTGNPSGSDMVLYGSVTSVRHTISSEPEHCSTGFGIVAVRTEAENHDDAYTTDRHPLYTNLWTGKGLL